ncbi:MAG: hypothetical protein ABIG68_12300 [Acidobacteriota bacterium]
MADKFPSDSRIQALLCVYFQVLLVETLLERELHQAMEREEIESLPMYPEARPCRCPTARRVIDLFDDIQRHTLDNGRDPPVVFVSELSDLQLRILKLLGVPARDYHASFADAPRIRRKWSRTARKRGCIDLPSAGREDPRGARPACTDHQADKGDPTVCADLGDHLLASFEWLVSEGDAGVLFNRRQEFSELRMQVVG